MKSIKLKYSKKLSNFLQTSASEMIFNPEASYYIVTVAFKESNDTGDIVLLNSENSFEGIKVITDKKKRRTPVPTRKFNVGDWCVDRRSNSLFRVYKKDDVWLYENKGSFVSPKDCRFATQDEIFNKVVQVCSVKKNRLPKTKEEFVEFLNLFLTRPNYISIKDILAEYKD
jgi:hypothetical protein